MFNTRFGKFRTKQKKYVVFIDETSSYKANLSQSGNAYPTNFITAFCILDAINLKKFNKSYRHKLYANNTHKEIKSFNTSDKTNRLALEVSKPYLAYALIFERKAHYFQAYDKRALDIHFALDLYSYFNPLDQILKYLTSLNPDVDLTIHIKLDEVAYFRKPDHFKLIDAYLHDLESKYTNSQQTIQLIFEMIDSQQHMGIQLADMLAGAYRKEKQYQASGEKVKLIPFNYHLQLSQQDLEHNFDFLKMFGRLSFAQVLDSVARDNNIPPQTSALEEAYLAGNLKHITTNPLPTKETALHLHPLQSINLNIQKHKLGKNITKTHQTLTICLTNNQSSGFRQRVTPYLANLNQVILENVVNPNGQFAKIKQNENLNTYQKNVMTIFNNLNKVKEYPLDLDGLRSINYALKEFCHRIPK